MPPSTFFPVSMSPVLQLEGTDYSFVFQQDCKLTYIKICYVKIISAVQICPVLIFYAAQIGSSTPTFPDNLLVPPARDKASNTVQEWTDKFFPKRQKEIAILRCVKSRKKAYHICTAAEACNQSSLFLYGKCVSMRIELGLFS